jgi:DNA-binding transcriptional MocR family regulator
MTINPDWTPHIEPAAGPRYRVIADALEEDIASGRLAEGARLPTHRDLADALGVTVGTVTRAYALARQRGLISGEVGRGTFVRAPAGDDTFSVGERDEPGAIDLSLSIAPSERRLDLLSQELVALAADPDLAELCTYQPEAGHPRHRAAGARWLTSLGVEARPEEVVVTGGAQHGLALSLAALTRPGDAVLTEALSYPGVQWVASQRGLRLEGVALDEGGLRADALAERVRQTGARVLYCTPHWQNPTGSTLSASRRAEVARVARDCDLMVVEDDVFRPMVADPLPPLGHFAPERCVTLTGLSKGVTAGLRVGFLKAPAEWAARIAVELRTAMWMTPPLMAELACRLIGSGAAEAMIAWKRDEMAKRHADARRHLPRWVAPDAPPAHHLWIPLPAPWTSETFVAEALRRGVRLAGTGTFAVGGAGPPAEGVRLSLLSPATRSAAERGFAVVAGLLASPAEPGLSVV